jgi:signal transduction histidine kinase
VIAAAIQLVLGRRPGLQGRFMMWFGLIVLTLMTSVVLVVEKRMAATLMRQTQMRGIAIAHSIAATVKSDLLNYDFVALQQTAETAVHDQTLAYVVILTKENVVAGYSGRPELQGQTLSDPVSIAAAAAERTVVQQLRDANGHEIEYLDLAVPVHVSGTPVAWGSVRVGLTLAPLRHALARMRLLLLGLGIAAVLITLVSARLLSRQIIDPIAGLAEATASIAAGNLDHNVQENLVGELGDLARSFNKMTTDLRRNRDAIRNHNQHLEKVVQQRTAALAQKARELEAANAELTELDRLKSDFLSNVSHELRTPLTAIRSFTEILLDPDPNLAPPERVEFLQIVAAQAERLTRLISDLLDLSKIEAGKFECRPLPVPVGQLVDSCIDSLRRLAADKGVTLRSEIETHVPLVWADVDRMNQVLTNLFDNAIKFTPRGGSVVASARVYPRRRCVIGVERDGVLPRGAFHGMESRAEEAENYVVVSIRDTGVGIIAADEQRIFDKFGQVGNILTDKPQGTGLGLPISGSIAVQHGGALWVESSPGVGSVFSVSIPVARVGAVRGAAGGGASTTHATVSVAPQTARFGRGDRDATAARDRGRSEVDAGSRAAANARVDDSAAEAGLVEALQRSTGGKRVLVVDDEPSIVAALTELLEPAGYSVIGCQTGSQAIARARDHRPDAIVLDIMMPEINGFDVLRLLKSEETTADIPVIVLSVLDDRHKALELGAAEYVRKPFEKSVLLQNVRQLA